MSAIKLKNIKQTVVSGVTQPLSIGGVASTKKKGAKVPLDLIKIDGYYRVWVDGYEGRYSIDRDANVYSHWAKHAYHMQPHPDSRGYSMITISKNSKVSSLKLHRLMCQAFIPNPKNKRTVNHKNGIKSDNSLENLEWNTYSENTKHAFANGLNRHVSHTHSEQEKRALGERRSMFTLNEADDILEYMSNYNISATKMAQIIGCDKSVTLNLSRGITRYFRNEVVA